KGFVVWIILSSINAAHTAMSDAAYEDNRKHRPLALHLRSKYGKGLKRKRIESSNTTH
ncbi:hypothetical protein AVEN_249528-1, partial [Araneus ventricosus]